MFSKGKIDIMIPKVNYIPGEIISGTVRLKMKKPAKARALNIYLMGIKKVKERNHTHGNDGHARARTTTRNVTVYDFEVPLDGEKEYSQEAEYPFEIMVPADVQNIAPQIPQVEGVGGTVLKIVQTAAVMTGNVSYPVKWYLHAKLDIPGGFDIKDNADISIRQDVGSDQSGAMGL